MKTKKNHPLLKKVEAALEGKYHVEFADAETLMVYMQPNSPQVCFIIADPDYPDGAIISFALDFPDIFVTADLCITTSHISKVYLGEGFFFDDEGKIHFGEEAATILAHSPPKDPIPEPKNKTLH
jgi:hypothetical protein